MVEKAAETDDARLLSIHKSVLEEWTFKIPLMQALMESELRFDGSACDVFELAHARASVGFVRAAGDQRRTKATMAKGDRRNAG